MLCFLVLGLLGLSGGENHEGGDTSVTGPFVLVFAGTVSAWLAHVWLKQGHESHANVAFVLPFVLFIGT